MTASAVYAAIGLALAPVDQLPPPVPQDNPPIDSDLAQLPSEVLEPTVMDPADDSESKPKLRVRSYVQSAMVWTQREPSSFSLSTERIARLRNISFFDLRGERSVGSDLTLVLSGRANLTAGKIDGNELSRPFRFDLREAHASIRLSENAFVDVGRINQKIGVAYGYNPTDLFRAGANVDPLTGDPTSLRENRIGSFMVRGQAFWDSGAVMLVWSPDLSAPRGLLDQARRSPFDLLLDRVNVRHRFVAKLEQQLPIDLRPEVLLALDGDVFAIGGNLTTSIGNALIVHGEYSGRKRRTVDLEALEFGHVNGDLPTAAFAPLVLQGARERFRHDMVIGATFTTSGNVTMTAEYHYDGSGLTRAMWEEKTAAAAQDSVAKGALRYFQLYANIMGRTTVRHSGFVRIAATDPFVKGLELAALSSFSLQDQSAYLQASASYAFSDRSNIAMTANTTIGNGSSSFANLGRSSRLVLSFRTFF